MTTTIVPVPLFGFGTPPDDNPLMLRAGPSLIFIPMFTSREYAFSFAEFAKLPPSLPLLELPTANLIATYLSGRMPANVELKIVFDPIELGTGEIAAWPLADIVSQLKAMQ